jgi:hypothetical protein
MDGMLTYSRNAERVSFSRPVTEGSLFSTMTDFCDDDEHIQVAGFAEYAMFVDRTAGSFIAALKQGNFASGYGDGMPHLDNTVNYAEQR